MNNRISKTKSKVEVSDAEVLSEATNNPANKSTSGASSGRSLSELLADKSPPPTGVIGQVAGLGQSLLIRTDTAQSMFAFGMYLGVGLGAGADPFAVGNSRAFNTAYLKADPSTFSHAHHARRAASILGVKAKNASFRVYGPEDSSDVQLALGTAAGRQALDRLIDGHDIVIAEICVATVDPGNAIGLWEDEVHQALVAISAWGGKHAAAGRLVVFLCSRVDQATVLSDIEFHFENVLDITSKGFSDRLLFNGCTATWERPLRLPPGEARRFRLSVRESKHGGLRVVRKDLAFDEARHSETKKSGRDEIELSDDF